MENQTLNPTFEALKPENINPFANAEPAKVLKNSEILTQLLEAVEPLDLHKLAFPQYEKLKKELEEQHAKLVDFH